MEWTHLLWYESTQLTFILAHFVTPLKWGWVHSIKLLVRMLSRMPQSNAIALTKISWADSKHAEHFGSLR